MITAAPSIDVAPEAGELSDDALAALAVLLCDWALADHDSPNADDLGQVGRLLPSGQLEKSK